MKKQLPSTQKPQKSLTSRRIVQNRKLIAIKKNANNNDHDHVAESQPPDSRLESEGHGLRQSHAVLPGIARSQTSLKSITPDSIAYHSPLAVSVSTPLPVPVAQQRTTNSGLPLWYLGDLTAEVEPHRDGVTVYFDNVKARIGPDQFRKFCYHCYENHSAEVDVVLESSQSGNFQSCLRRSVVTIYLLWIEDDASVGQAVTKLRRAVSMDGGLATYVALLSERCSPAATASLKSAAAALFKSAADSMQQPDWCWFDLFFVTSSQGVVDGLADHLNKCVDSCFKAAVTHQKDALGGKWTPWLESAYNNVRWCHYVTSVTSSGSAGTDRLHKLQRETVDRKLRAALHDEHDVIAVTGPVGSGKTWLVARAAADFARDCRAESRQCVAIVRFCGLGSTMSTYGRLLHDVLCQLQDALPSASSSSALSGASVHHDGATSPASVSALLEYGNGGGSSDQLFAAFRRAVVAAAEAHPAATILLVLDGLDYLLDAARTSAFLSALTELPPGIVVLVSIKEPIGSPASASTTAEAVTSSTSPDAANAWHASLLERGCLVTLPDAINDAEVMPFLSRQLSDTMAAMAAPALSPITRVPLFLTVLAETVRAAAGAAVTPSKQADAGAVVQLLTGKSLYEALQISGINTDEIFDKLLRFCTAIELSCYETATAMLKEPGRLGSSAGLWDTYVVAAEYRLQKAALLFDVIVGGCRAYIWQHAAFGQDWTLSAAEPVEWLRIQVDMLRNVLLYVFAAIRPDAPGGRNPYSPFSEQLGPVTPSLFTSDTPPENAPKGPEAALSAAASAGRLTEQLRPRLLYILPLLLSKYCASVFDFSQVVLFFNDSEPAFKEMKDLVFATYCGYPFITAKLRHAGVRSLLHDLEDFLAVWAFKFESARTGVERTGLTAFEQLYAFLVTHEKLLAKHPDAFEGALTGTMGIDISMEHDRVAVTYELALSQLAARRALRLSTASLRVDSTKFDPRCVSNPVKNMMLRREKQYYSSNIVDNNGVHLSHSTRGGEAKVWRSDGTLMFEKAFEGKVVCCTAVAGRKNVFAVTTAQTNTERELTLAVHCVGDCYWYRAGDLGPRDTIAAWLSPDVLTLITCDKVSSDTLRVKLCRPAPVALSQQPHDEVRSKMGESQVQMTFISRYLELPQLVEDALYAEMKEHSEREGGSERAELKYYSSMTADETHLKLDIAGLDADADGMHAMRYLWTEMRQLIDPEYFSLPIDEVCSTNLKLDDVITRTEVTVLGYLRDSGIVVIRAVSNDGNTTVYVMRAMSDERLEMQKELMLDHRAVLDLSSDGLLVYADGSTPLTVWNLAANEKDVLDSSSCHGPEGITCIAYVTSTCQVYAFSPSGASIWDVKSCTLVKAVPWQLASKVTAVAISDKWVIVGLEDGDVYLYVSWKHVSSFKLQGAISSIYVGKVEGESIKFSCIHNGLPSASIAFLTWSADATGIL